MAEEKNKQLAASREPASPARFDSARRAGVPEAGSSKGMSSGAKWGIGIGGCCCCLIIVILVVLILGFAGCSMFRGFGGYNWPSTPSLDNGTEIPVPSFSNTPTSTK
ncbi:hypothetical protein KJ713_01600 [Patescibacteria group bacterium]|nr:hypothetical protein [Patescibacteria group bacterium]